jgi:formyl-CoA transferase
MNCATGILIALLERESSGVGQAVASSLLQAMIATCDFQAARWTMAHEVPGQAGNDHPTSIPTGVFKTRDGHINIAASGQHIYQRLCEAIGAPELVNDERFAIDKARSSNRVALNAALEARTTQYDSAALVALLNAAGVPAGPIYTMDQVFADPQVQHLEMARPVHSAALGDIELVSQAIELGRTKFAMRSAAPEQGEHTDEVLREFGYDAAAIADLRRRNIV